jgi:non-canonical (house-cleaning) NTP pyrophosphatase
MLAVGTQSEIKIKALTTVFGKNFKVTGCDGIESGVPSQPIGIATFFLVAWIYFLGKAQTQEGATNRAKGAMIVCPNADAWFGIGKFCLRLLF